jgi:hypothetical protein
MPDLIRHPVFIWIPAFAGMTTMGYLIAGLIVSGIASFRVLRLYALRKGVLSCFRDIFFVPVYVG